jgi:pre-mRNA-splicing factor SYF1
MTVIFECHDRHCLGKSRHDLWTELLTLIAKNPDKIKSMDVDAVIRGGIRRFSHEVGTITITFEDHDRHSLTP